MSNTQASPIKSLTARQREWLSHLEAWRERGGTLKAYASANELSVSGLYSARRVLEQHGVWPSRARNETREVTPPKLVPVRLTSVLPVPAMYRLVLPSGVILEIPEHADPARCRVLLASVSEVLR